MCACMCVPVCVCVPLKCALPAIVCVCPALCVCLRVSKVFTKSIAYFAAPAKWKVLSSSQRLKVQMVSKLPLLPHPLSACLPPLYTHMHTCTHTPTIRRHGFCSFFAQLHTIMKMLLFVKIPVEQLLLRTLERTHTLAHTLTDTYTHTFALLPPQR